MKYLVFAACERFRIDPDSFCAKPMDRQMALLGYELVRHREEKAACRHYPRD